MSYDISDLNKAFAEARYQIFSFKEWAEERLEKLEDVGEKLHPKSEELFNKMMEFFKKGKSEEAHNAEREYNNLEEKRDSISGEISCLQDLLYEFENLELGNYALDGFDEELNDSLIKGE